MTNALGTLRDRLLGWLLPNASEVRARSFGQYCDARFDGITRALALGLFVGSVLWWPTDLVILRRLPGATGPYARWRVTVGVVTLLYVIVPRTPFVRRHVRALFAALTLVGCALVAWMQAPLGGPETPWFHLLYVVPFFTLPLPLPLRDRVASTAALSAATLGGYVVPVPAHHDSPFVPWMASFFVATTAMSVIFGHALFEAVRENFRQSRALEEQNELLERRVADRTDELRQLVDHVERAREAERRRVARDLHDDLGQELVALRYAVARCDDHRRDSSGSLEADLQEVQDQVKRMSASMRALLDGLRPVVLDELGLVAAAEWLLRGTERRTGLACRLTLEGKGLDALDAHLGAEVYRIVQESITNVVRHASARSVEVRIEALDDALDVRVTDDGVGLGDRRPDAGGRFGLVGMRERAGVLGGTLTFRSLPGGGTEVHCHLPIVRPPVAQETT